MTRDDFIRISKERAKGIVTGAVIVLLVGAIVFWPRVQKLPESEPEVAFTGVPDDFIDRYEVVAAAYPEPFRSVAPGIEQQDNSRKNVRLYEACPPLWPGPQQTGDCVSMGISTPIYVRACITAGVSGVPIPPSQVFQPHQYGIARVQIEAKDLEGAREALAQVPPDQANHADIVAVRAALDLAEEGERARGAFAEFEAKLAADPNDHQARLDLSTALYAAGEREAAMDHLLESIRRDRKWNEEAARKQLLKLFEALGFTDPLAAEGRKRLSSILFS